MLDTREMPWEPHVGIAGDRDDAAGESTIGVEFLGWRARAGTS